MLLKGDTELILPLSRKHGCAAHLGFSTFLGDSLVHFRRSQIEHKEVFTICADELSQNLVSVVRVPAHHIKQLHKEDLARYLAGFALAAAVGTPLKRMQVRFKAGTDSQLACLSVDQKLNVIDLRQALDASGVQADFVIVEGDRRFADVGKEFTADNLKLIQAEGVILFNPIIDQYRGSKYMVTLFCSGKKPLYDETHSLLKHNR